ncbi:hypothetical protein GCM10008967_37740 [Bacillus carboniphilus]|uniref:Uncharacterized protein n=1 Tax=Bacillus carboniphilus TaxID=86663 RepID=A0ABN0WPY8_9BACI
MLSQVLWFIGAALVIGGILYRDFKKKKLRRNIIKYPPLSKEAEKQIAIEKEKTKGGFLRM